MRQARIRKLCKQLVPEQSEGYREDSDEVPPYFIGKSQNHPIELPAFVQTKKHDPAVKVRGYPYQAVCVTESFPGFHAKTESSSPS